MYSRTGPELSYPERLATFEGFWDHNEATARQLAATGHVYDRPPIEAMYESSHCISCKELTPRASSIKTLEGPMGRTDSDFSHHHAKGFSLHKPGCQFLQSRIPLEIHSETSASNPRIGDLKKRFERVSTSGTAQPVLPEWNDVNAKRQTSPIFSLPTEIRLQIYSYVLPSLESSTTIVPLNHDSGRIITAAGLRKVGRRDTTKINILSTCHLIYEEAVDMIFSNVTYRFDTSKVLYVFLRRIGSRGRQLLKSVDLVCGSREDAITLALLASCPKLKHIVLRFARPWLIYQTAPIWVLDGVACLLELSGLESVKFDETGKAKVYLSSASKDGRMVERELKRPRGSKGNIRWVNGTIDA